MLMVRGCFGDVKCSPIRASLRGGTHFVLPQPSAPPARLLLGVHVWSPFYSACWCIRGALLSSKLVFVGWLGPRARALTLSSGDLPQVAIAVLAVWRLVCIYPLISQQYYTSRTPLSAMFSETKASFVVMVAPDSAGGEGLQLARTLICFEAMST